MEMLQEFYFFPLDIFFSIKHNNDKETIESELEAWLYFLGSDRAEDIMKLINTYPEFIELYKDICQFRCQPEVAIMMFSEALRKLDENTVKYMIEEQKKEIEENKKLIKEQAEEIREQKEEIREQAEEIKEQAEEIREQAEEIKRLEQLLAEKE